LFRFSTSDLPVPERRNAVLALRERGILPLEPLADRPVTVQISKHFLPGVGILSGTLSGLSHGSGAKSADVSDELFFGVNLDGGCTAFQGNREIGLNSGEAMCLSCEVGPFVVVRPEPVRFLGLRVPRNMIAPLVKGLDDATMHVIPRGTEAVTLLARYAEAVATMQRLDSPEVSRSVVNHVHDLIALSIGATREGAAAAEATSVAAARLQSIKADIDANLSDESISVAAVAARHGVTPRYVHKLFEREGITYTQFVLLQRLERAHRLLRDPRFATSSISVIAFDVGFGDISYFNRVFRRHYNATPSDIRNFNRD
jgi:AraC-like DNA-binding protein